MTTTPSVPSWADWSAVHQPSFRTEPDGSTQVWLLDPQEEPLGAQWTPNTADWRSEGGASLSSLAEVLVTFKVPMRYSLSPAACAGILARAANRQRTLPERLRLALEKTVAQAATLLTPTP